MVTTVRNN